MKEAEDTLTSKETELNEKIMGLKQKIEIYKKVSDAERKVRSDVEKMVNAKITNLN